MQRTIVQITRMRISDVVEGDVINNDPDGTRGWFEVGVIRRLHDGTLSLCSENGRNSCNGSESDIVGVQVAKVVDIAGAAAPV